MVKNTHFEDSMFDLCLIKEAFEKIAERSLGCPYWDRKVNDDATVEYRFVSTSGSIDSTVSKTAGKRLFTTSYGVEFKRLDDAKHDVFKREKENAFTKLEEFHCWLMSDRERPFELSHLAYWFFYLAINSAFSDVIRSVLFTELGECGQVNKHLSRNCGNALADFVVKDILFTVLDFGFTYQTKKGQIVVSQDSKIELAMSTASHKVLMRSNIPVLPVQHRIKIADLSASSMEVVAKSLLSFAREMVVSPRVVSEAITSCN